jgi:hypothetical protein
MLLIPTLLAFVGLALSTLVALLVLRGAFAAINPSNWQEKWLHASFITFAWHELGRGIFLGLLAAVGTAPLSVAFFAGSQTEISNMVFLVALAWAAFATGIFFLGVTTGLIGFLRFEAGHPSQHSVITFVQLTVVAVASLPVLVVFLYYLVPNLTMVIGLWLDTMGLYAKMAS